VTDQLNNFQYGARLEPAVHCPLGRATFVSTVKLRLGRRRGFSVLDGATKHFHNDASSYLDERPRNRWIGRGGPMEWPPRSPDLTPTDLFL
jgi:hypothetical protein